MLAIVAPGQGAQKPGFIGSWLAHEGFADRLADFSQEITLDLAEPGKATDTDWTRDTALVQPLLLTTALCSADALFGSFGTLARDQLDDARIFLRAHATPSIHTAI